MKKYFALLFIGTLAISSCVKDTLVFPESVETEKVESAERAPVKPNYIEVTPLLGGDIEFAWNEVDKETVKSLSLTYNDNGESTNVSITDFSHPHVIKDLTVGKRYYFTFQAIGLKGEESKAFTLSATPSDAVADLVIQTVSENPACIGDAHISWRNRTGQSVTVNILIDGNKHSTGLTDAETGTLVIPGFANGDFIAKISVVDSVGKVSTEGDFPFHVEWIVEKIGKQLTVNPEGIENVQISWLNPFATSVTIKAVIDGTTYTSTTIASELGSFVIPGISRGAHDVKVTITDADNKSSVAKTYPVLVKMAVDAVADRINIPATNPTGAIVVNWGNPASTPVTIHAVVNGITYSSPVSTEATGLFTLPLTFTPGTYQVKVRVKDSNDNLSIEQTYSVRVLSPVLLVNNGWSITASNEYTPGENTGLATALIDGNLNTYWHTSWQASGPNYPHWVELDMKVASLVGRFAMARRQNNGTGMTTFRLEGSLNGTTWVTVLNNTNFNSTINGFQVFSFTPQNFRYLRLTPLTGPNNYTHLAEIQVYEYK